MLSVIMLNVINAECHLMLWRLLNLYIISKYLQKGKKAYTEISYIGR
jgi:hypothetical protein